MTNKVKNEYQPEVFSHPGEVLNDLLSERGMPQVELAERTGRPVKTINEIIHGKAAIIPDTAIQLERVLRVPASYWLNHQRLYDESIAVLKAKEKLQVHVDWLKQFRIRAMAKLGWIKSFKDEVDQLKEVLSYFGVNSPEEWDRVWLKPEAIYRKSPAFECNSPSLCSRRKKTATGNP